MPAGKATHERDGRLDVARGIGIAMVIYGHSLEPLFLREDGQFLLSAFTQWQFLYSFHMPLFFLLAGASRGATQLRFGFAEARRLVVRDALSLLLLVEVHHVLSGGLHALDLWRKGVHGFHELLVPVLRSALTLSGFSLNILWFLVALALSLALTALWSARPRMLARSVVILVCGLSLVASLRTGPAWDTASNWFQIRSLGPALVFVAAGKLAFRRYPPVWLGLIALLALTVVFRLNTGCPLDPSGFCPDVPGHFAVWMILGRLGFLPLFLLTSVLGCVVVLALASVVPAASVPARAIGFVGRQSLPIYLINAYLLDFVITRITRFDPMRIGGLDFVAIFVATLAVHLALLFVLRSPLARIRKVCDDLARMVVEGLMVPAVRRLSGGRTVAKL